MDFTTTLKEAARRKASDLFIVAGLPLACKTGSVIEPLSPETLSPQQTKVMIEEIYTLARRDISRFVKEGDDDFSFALAGVSRFRISAYHQRGSYAAVIRVVQFTLPNPSEMGIPDEVMRLSTINKGMVLVTGPAGSGKSTTLACIINKINQERNTHIITLEDPIEYLHSHNKSIVSQREVGSDTTDYITALRAALRQAPDVILLGEMRDSSTISVAMTAAETGHLMLSTLHTVGAANTIDRIIDAFPPQQQQQIRVQLSMVLMAVVSQQLLPTLDGKIAPAYEIMIVNSAIRTLIRESKVYQIDTAIFSGSSEGMRQMDASILALYKEGRIDKATALTHASNPDLLAKKL